MSSCQIMPAEIEWTSKRTTIETQRSSSFWHLRLWILRLLWFDFKSGIVFNLTRLLDHGLLEPILIDSNDFGPGSWRARWPLSGRSGLFHAAFTFAWHTSIGLHKQPVTDQFQSFQEANEADFVHRTQNGLVVFRNDQWWIFAMAMIVPMRLWALLN